MKKIYLVLFAMISFITCLFAAEPTAGGVRGVPTSQIYFNTTVPQMLSYQVPAMLIEDTVITARVISPKPIIESIYIMVTDTVESQGDSVYFKLFLGGTAILNQKTSTFKLPGAYTFTPLTRTASANSALYYSSTNTTSGQTSGITEGTYKVIIRYLNP
jgi:hypothetical protein